MTITRRWQSGFELNSALEVTGLSTATPSNTVAHTQTYSLRIAGNATAHAYVTIASTTQARIGFFFRHNGATTGDPQVIKLLSGGAAGTAVVSIRWNGTNFAVFCGGSQVASDALILAANTWYHLGFDIKIHAGSGWVYSYLDGVEVNSYDGETDQGAASFDTVRWGNETGLVWTDYAYMDDAYIDDAAGEATPTALAAHIYEMIRPGGNGYLNDFIGSDADSTDNYLLVDEVTPDNDTTFVQSPDSGDIDAYAAGNITLAPGFSVVSVIPLAVAKTTSASDLQLLTRLSATNAVSGNKTLGTGYGVVWDRQTTKPGGGAWSESDVNSAEIGVKIP